MARQKYYAVWTGKVPGVYSDWASCKAQIHEYPKAEYKGYATKYQAERAFLAGCRLAAAALEHPPIQTSLVGGLVVGEHPVQTESHCIRVAPPLDEPAPGTKPVQVPGEARTKVQTEYHGVDLASGEARSKVELYTDGACINNPGPGGWGYILRHTRTGTESEASGGEFDTTNQRMELTAAIKGLEALRLPCVVELFSDSRYVTDGISKWLPNWLENNWLTSNKKKIVTSRDLWERVADLVVKHTVNLHWIKGHSGHPENERCDRLAEAAAATMMRQLRRRKPGQ